MGQLSGKLTNSGVTPPGGQTQYFDQSQVQSGAMAKALTPQPGSLQQQDSQLPGGSPAMQQGAPPMPQASKPSFMQAASMDESAPGAGNALSPGLSKMGKLAVLLTGGVKGAMAGEAASANAVMQSGGRRGGNFGSGFEAAQSMPWERAMQGQQLQQAQAQTALTRSQSDMVQTPYGMLPAGLAKVIFPAAIRGGATEQAATTRAGATEQAAQTNAGARIQGAQIGAGARTTAAQTGADARIKAAQLNLGPLADVSQDLQDQFGLPPQLPLRMLNQAETAANKPLSVVQGEAGPAVVNKAAAAQGSPGGAPKSLGLGSPRLGGATQVADSDNPGNTKVVTAGQAVRSGAAGSQSASVSVPKAAAMAEVPTNIGDQKVAFTTMIQHADLMRRAAKALDNGDMQTLSGLENAFKNEFGYSGPITASAIADAYKGEVSNVINKGHITDTGSEKVAHTLDPTKQNYKTIDSVLGAYQALAQSKMDMLNKQKQNAVNQSQPRKPGAAAPAQSAPPHQVGDAVSIKGKPMKITAVHPDGSFDAQ